MGDRNRNNFRKLMSSFKSPVTARRRGPGVPKWKLPASQDHSDAALPRPSHRERLGDAGQSGFEFGMDDDVPLDAFDRELLAQLATEQEQAPNERGGTKHGSSYPLRQSVLTPGPNTNSKNYHNSTIAVKTPPFRGLASSSSDFGPLSSPSLGVKNRNRARMPKDNNTLIASPHWPPPGPSVSSPDVASPDHCRVSSASPAETRGIKLGHAPPMVQGIRLVSTHELPDRFRSIFSFPLFNAIQSKCFHPIYHGDHNLALSAPTGSGKTVIMELAICRLLANLKDTRFKVVYQAPTKSLCSERFRDWQARFSGLDLQCAELTGDTDQAQMRNVQNASIIITTPEKWDSMTRKWKDHARLMQLVKLFLIDEVHIVKETRGATLEAVVSRMKSVDSNVRFVALSATVPNSEDIAAWLGRDPTNQHLPAHRERFGEEFRPVKLQKFVYGYQSNGNDFVFDKVCDTKLPEVISKHSCRKPIIIFCCTRNSAITTSKNLAKIWNSMNVSARQWKGPTKPIAFQNVDLKGTVSAGVAFHHAGLDSGDRHAVETGFLEGQINVICCTSTLAVGVNLPCHLVIIKNTVSWQNNGCKEYADLEMMQMLGRAGRPQFDDSAAAVILTRKTRVDHYERLVAGSEPLESCLHLNLIDHLNAEIGLGTITDVESAVKWLAGTFLFVRLHKNPVHYKLKEGSSRADEEEMLREICEKDINLLQESTLVTPQTPLRSTEFGDAMARYYVKFETMKLFLSLPPRAKISEILSAIAQADEFREIRLKSGEKSLYKELNKGSGIKFPIKVDIALAAHKISLLIQAELGAVEIPTGDQFQKHKHTFQQEKTLVLSHVNRLIRCIIDCQISLDDSVGTRNALELARSFGARVWDNSALQMKQIDQIGIVAVRKLATAGINSIEALENIDAARIEMVLSKNPPFGAKLLTRLADFPKPRVSVKLAGKDIKPGKLVKIKFKVDIGFMNEKAPTYFQRRPVYVCFLAETSDGRIIDFRRISAIKLQKWHEILLTVELTPPYQYISCYVMCDEIAGTMCQAELKPGLAESLFPAQTSTSSYVAVGNSAAENGNDDDTHAVRPSRRGSDEFEDDFLNDRDLLAVVEDLDSVPRNSDRDKNPDRSSLDSLTANRDTTKRRSCNDAPVEPEPTLAQLDNGKWACNHKCKDKTTCKHLCCREGTDRPPRVAKKKQNSNALPIEAQKAKGPKSAAKAAPKSSADKRKYRPGDVDTVDLTIDDTDGNPDVKKLNKGRTQDGRLAEPYFQRLFARSADRSKPHSSDVDDCLPHGFLEEFENGEFGGKGGAEQKISSDYGSMAGISDLPSLDEFLQIDQGLDHNPANTGDVTENGSFIDNSHEPVEEVTDERLSILEDELTDYQQYINIADGKASPASGSYESAISGSAGDKQSSPLDSTNTTTTAPAIFSPAYPDGVVSLSSDSLFFQEPNFLPSSTSKRSYAEEHDSIEATRYHTPSKRPRHVLQESISPSRLNLRAEPASEPRNAGKEEQQYGGGNDYAWEDIDGSLLEEYKDFVNFF